MARQRFHKLFSAEEANQLLPRLQILIRELQVQANALRERIRELARADERLRGLDLPEVLERYPELAPLAARMSELAAEIESTGGLLKDIDLGLVDFPFEIGETGDGEVEIGFLCWQYGEPNIVAWHPLGDGFAGRRPLPGASKVYLN